MTRNSRKRAAGQICERICKSHLLRCLDVVRIDCAARRKRLSTRGCRIKLLKLANKLDRRYLKSVSRYYFSFQTVN